MRIFFLSIICTLGLAASASAERPKYGKLTQPLAVDWGYLKSTSRTDFWRLVPYYNAQVNERSSGVASAAMVLNALFADSRSRAGSKNVDADEIGKLNSKFRKNTSKNGREFALDDFGDTLRKALEAAEPESYTVLVERFDGKIRKAELKRFEKLLAANEKSSDDYIILNVLHGVVTGDSARTSGHFAPIGAYDTKKKRVLILDPDRKAYEPYWVPADKVLDAINTTDPGASKKRGLVVVKRGAPPPPAE